MQFIATTNNTSNNNNEENEKLMKATATSCRLSDELTGISVSHFSQLEQRLHFVLHWNWNWELGTLLDSDSDLDLAFLRRF